MASDDRTLEQMIEDEAPGAAPAMDDYIAAEAPETGDKFDVSEPPADTSQPRHSAPDDGPLVPRKALEDERKKRQAFEQRVKEFEQRMEQQQQPPPQHYPEPDEIPDPILDPVGAMQYQQRMFETMHQRSLAEIREREYRRGVMISDMQMRERHTDYDEVVNYAVEVAKNDPMLLHQIVNAELPGVVAYEIGRKQKLLQEIDDPQSYRDKLKAEIMAELGMGDGQQPAQQPKPSRAPVPKSLAQQSSAQPRDDRGRFSGPASLEDILG